MSVGALTLGAFAIGVGAWMFWRRKAPKFTITLFLIAGGVLGGLLGTLLGTGLDVVISAMESTAGQLIGIGGSTIVSVLAVVATLELVVMGLWGKKAKPQRWHPFLALALPTVIVAGAVPILSTVLGAFQQATDAVGGALV